MKSWLSWPLLAITVSIAGCLGNSGSSQPSPPALQAVAGDGTVTLTWNIEPGVEYWVFVASDPTLNTLNWPNLPDGRAIPNAGMPTTLCNGTSGITVLNGLALYATVNARTGTSPGGPGSPVVSATPRPAGDTWLSGKVTGIPTKALGFAEQAACPAMGIYVAVGPSGAVSWNSGPSATDTDWKSVSDWAAANWLPAGATAPAVSLNAVTSVFSLVPAAFRFVAVGDGGVSAWSIDGKNWNVGVPPNASTTANPDNQSLRAITFASGQFIAVGDGGIIEASPDGINWTSQSWPASVSPSNLHAIRCLGAECVALGDNGLLLSTSGAGWVANNVGSDTLRAVAYGNFDLSVANGGVVAINTWVAVGDNGAYAYLPSGAPVWTIGAIPGAANLVDIAYTTRFVAVDANGIAYTNPFHAANPGAGWQVAAGGTGIAAPSSLISNGNHYIVAGTDGSLASSF